MNTNFKQVENRVCEYCEDNYEAVSTSKRKYCSNTCKTYASQERTGKRKAIISKESLNTSANDPNFEKTLETYGLEIFKLKRIAGGLRMLIREIQDLGTWREKNDLEELEFRLNNWVQLPDNIEEEKHNEDAEEKNRVQKQIIVLRSIIQNVDSQKSKLDGLESKFRDSLLSVFKKTQERNSFYKLNIPTSGEINGSDINRFLNYQTKYPLKKFEGYDFIKDLGSPMQPFIMSIEGEKQSGKTILATSLTKFFFEVFESKCLYVGSFKQIQSAVSYFKRRKAVNNFLTVLHTETINSIPKALEKLDYEFLIIDDARFFNINYPYIQNLQRKYPFLSIILTADQMPKLIKENSFSYVRCEIYNMTYGTNKIVGSNAVIYKGEERGEEENIFVSNEGDGKTTFSFNVGYTHKNPK